MTASHLVKPVKPLFTLSGAYIRYAPKVKTRKAEKPTTASGRSRSEQYVFVASPAPLGDVAIPTSACRSTDIGVSHYRHRRVALPRRVCRSTDIGVSLHRHRCVALPRCRIANGDILGEEMSCIALALPVKIVYYPLNEQKAEYSMDCQWIWPLWYWRNWRAGALPRSIQKMGGKGMVSTSSNDIRRRKTAW